MDRRYIGLALIGLLAWVAILLPSLLPACPTEDSNFCHWDASQHGNGMGNSFVTLFDHTFLLPKGL